MLSREERLTGTFVELADSLVDRFDIVDLLTVLAERSVEIFDVDAAGLLMSDAAGELRLMAATSEAIHMVELMQLQADQGPCLDCFRSGAPVLVADLGEDGGPLAPLRARGDHGRLPRRPRPARCACAERCSAP